MTANIHPHGSHECFCVNCGYTEIVPAYVKCDELQCSACGDRMRARETGEYRGTQYGRSRITRGIRNVVPPECPSYWPFLLLGLIIGGGVSYAVVKRKG